LNQEIGENRPDMGRLDGRVAVITGTGGGQGRAAALLFAREGARVVGCDVKVEGARKTVEQVRGAGGEMSSVAPIDLAEPGGGEELIAHAVSTYGRVDILYNNAAAAMFVPIESLTPDSWSFTLRNELDLVYHACHFAWPHLIASHGAIVNIASGQGLRGNTRIPSSAHAAAKGGVIALTLQLAAEGVRHGIRANAISPGIVDTPAIESAMNDALRERIAGSPMGRMARPEEIAHAALFLASDEASFITAANLSVDGGITMLQHW
jgi:meso-butanediol dehydrogenase / (S,S)-butanediol dehydrogenase / diacetyl reductase